MLLKSGGDKHDEFFVFFNYIPSTHLCYRNMSSNISRKENSLYFTITTCNSISTQHC